ncbi:hypothetical protein [Saccharicrinis aurantiacus]|uniref:hypothetical protein n=1 Tax=Saccharicrinis aurantiacus TaxID=1849719 RepID=UPI0024921AC6|nr:hypothetical protein [Saccharicrinis aurantiacus]
MKHFFIASINYDFQRFGLLIFGLLGLLVVFFQLFQIIINKKNGIKKKPIYSLIVISCICALVGIRGYLSWTEFKSNKAKTVGITVRHKIYAKASSVIEYEYYVNGNKYIDESSYGSADLKKIKIPGGKYPVYYNTRNPKISEMDFSKVPKSIW